MQLRLVVSGARLLIVLCLSRKHLPALPVVYSSCNSNNHRRVKTTFNFLQCKLVPKPAAAQEPISPSTLQLIALTS